VYFVGAISSSTRILGGKQHIEALDLRLVAPGTELLGDELDVGPVVGRTDVVRLAREALHPGTQICPVELGIELPFEGTLACGTGRSEPEQWSVRPGLNGRDHKAKVQGNQGATEAAKQAAVKHDPSLEKTCWPSLPRNSAGCPVVSDTIGPRRDPPPDRQCPPEEGTDDRVSLLRLIRWVRGPDAKHAGPV
jgi:hypothetical protein